MGIVAIKKNLAVKLLLTTSLASLLITPPVFAEGTGDNQTPTEDIKTQEQIDALEEKEGDLEEFLRNKYKEISREDIHELSTSEIQRIFREDEKVRDTIGIKGFEQETSYWCGPATVKQVLHYINGSSKSQKSYAKELGTTTDGTDFSLIDDVLNDNQSKNKYVYTTHDSDQKYKFLDKIEYGIEHDYPVILDLSIKPEYMPLYKKAVKGHILNASGYDWRDWELRLTDPFDQGGRGVTLGNTWHPADGVWKANQNHFRSAVIW
ncbi:C39 family peptidase [Brevibacillus laterosporus]|uniref:C39 family peptidase n=1 Tax=Brevibacillus laterosporus TaxID=1465 RepID=UPI003D21078D